MQKPPKNLSIAAPPASVPPSVPTIPSVESTGGVEVRDGQFAVKRIKTALGIIIDRPSTPTGVKCALSEFQRVCNPKLERSTFPVTLHRAIGDKDNARELWSKWGVLYHYVGSAIDSMQECYRKRLPVEDAERRIKLLEEVAAVPIEKLEVAGDGAKGFYFVVPE